MILHFAVKRIAKTKNAKEIKQTLKKAIETLVSANLRSVKIGMICDGCKKIDVCKYTEQIKKFEKNIKKDGLPEIIKVKYSCIHKDNGQLFRRNMNKELEVYIEEYRKLKKNREIINSIDSDFFFDFADTMLNYIENSIPKKKVEEKIEELNKQEQELQNSISEEEREEFSDANISFELMNINIRREILQELLEVE